MSLIGALNTATSGMKVGQIGINTASHNISNMNTPGYVRQRLEQSTTEPYYQPGFGHNRVGIGQVGTGVQGDAIVRIKNSFYDYQFRSESPAYGNTVSKYNYYVNMESIFNEPSETSISNALNDFYDGFNELSKNPNNVGAKNIAIESAKYLGSSITKVYDSLDKLQKETAKDKENIINSINDEIAEIQDLDKRIQIVLNNGDNPNDLLDRRDMLLDSLSSKIDLNHKDLQGALADGKLEIDEVKDLGIDGSLQGVLEMESELDKYKNELSKMIQGLADSVNGVYKNGLNGADAKDFFKVKVENGKVVGIGVNEDFVNDPSSLQMTSDKALELGGLKDKKITIDGEDISVVDFYNGIVQDLGHATQNIKKLEKNQSKLLNSIDTARWNIAGVSQDEEMVSLIQYQHAYKASAKVVSVVDNLLDVVINGLIR